LRKFKDSKALTAEKAQHDPHCYWFLTGFTAPLVVQSTAAGRAVTVTLDGTVTVLAVFLLYPNNWALNSARLKSAY